MVAGSDFQRRRRSNVDSTPPRLVACTQSAVRAHQQVGLVGGGQDDRDHRADPGVADLGQQRVVGEAAGELGGVRLRALDAQVQGAQAAQREPGLERPGRVALDVAAALEHGVQLVVAGDDRTQL